MPGPARVGKIGAWEQAPGCLFGVRDGSLPEFGGECGQHVWRAGRQFGCCLFGELIEQADGRRLAGVVAADQGEDHELLVALGAEAGGDVLDGAGEGGLGDAGQRVRGVGAGLGGDLEPGAGLAGVVVAPPGGPGQRGVRGSG